MKTARIHSVHDRPPRAITMSELGIPPNPFKHFDLTKPFLHKLAPIITSSLMAVLKGEIIHGAPVKRKDIMVEMHDGTMTALDVYLPRKVYKKRLKCPTILVRTPYWKDQMGDLLGSVFSQAGMACVVQDIRGTGHSNKTSTNTFLIFEREDAIDIIDWIKGTFWFNNRLGMWGASYLGMTQWCIYDNQDVTAFNTQVSSPRNLWYQHNGLDINEASITLSRVHCDGAWFHDNVPEATKEKMPYWRYTLNFLQDPAANMYNAKMNLRPKLSFKDLDVMSKDEINQKVQDLYGVDLRGCEPDPQAFQQFAMDIVWGKDIDRFHEFMTGNIGMDYARITSPNLIIAGWYDVFARINMLDFQSIMTRAGGRARRYTKMVVGPWVHGGVNHPDIKNPLNGGILDMLRQFVNIDWFRYWLQDKQEDGRNQFECYDGRDAIENEFINMPPLLIFTIGRNRWRWERHWPLARTRYKNLYLHSAGDANSVTGGGFLDFSAPETSEAPDTYEFDPADPVITRGGNNLHIPKGSMEQSTPESRDDVLVYTSNRLDADVEITGNIKVILHVASTALDTDFMVKLCNVYPNGKSFNISDLGIRARYRHGVLETPELLEPGKIHALEFELFPTSTLVKKGHRLRVDITSSDFPKYNVNSNMGGRGAEGEYMIAKQKVYHDKDHPSCIVLPTIPTSEDGNG